MDRPVVTVFGATDAAGGSLVRSLLADPARPFRVRAATRRPGSAAAEALAAIGAEIVDADLDDPEGVRRAMRFAHAAFAVGDLWPGEHAERLPARAVSLADAARREGTRHVVWATPDDPRCTVQPAGTPAREGAADPRRDTARQFAERGVPLTRLHVALPWELLLRLSLGPRRDGDGRLVLALPLGAARLPGIACADVGVCAAALLRRGEAVAGGALTVVGEHLSGTQMAQTLARVLGEPVRYVAGVPADVPVHGPAADVLAVLRRMRDHEPAMRAARASNVARALHPAPTSFEAWLRGDGARWFAPRAATPARDPAPA